MEKSSEIKKPTLAFAVMVLTVLSVVIGVAATVFKIQMIFLLLFSWLLLLPFVLYLGKSTDEVENSAYKMIQKGLGVMVIMLAVGALIAIWLCSGTVQAIIYYGLKYISPPLFLVITVVVCSLAALANGSAWGTIGTVGVAFIGIGAGLGIPLPLVAGAIISGTYFGDKMSPVSDTVLLNATIAGCSVMDHIKQMLYSTIPAYIIGLVAYLILGISYAKTGASTTEIDTIASALSTQFKLGFPVWLPAIVVLALLIMKKNTTYSLMVGTIVGTLVAILYQGYSIQDVGGFLVTGFKTDTGNELLQKLLNRGGMNEMLSLVGIIIGALGLGGILNGSGIIDVLVEGLAKLIKSVKALVLTTQVSCLLASALVATNQFSMIMVGTIMAPLYKKYRLKPQNMSRVIEDTNTLLSLFIPWNVGCLFVSKALGVSTQAAMPFAFISLLTILFDIIFAFTGFSMTKYSNDEWEKIQADNLIETKTQDLTKDTQPA